MIRLDRFLRDRRGATAIEYALIAALIGMAVLAGALALGAKIDGAFTSYGDKVRDAGS